jgi:hypothetical protein
MIVAAVALLALAAAAYGSHILNGGFYYDDWANAAHTHQPPGGGGFGEAVAYYADFTAYRPTLILYVPLTHEVFGLHTGVHLAWAASLAALMSWTFYGVLRLLGLERVHAGVIAALVLVFPFSDVTRLWSTASMTHLSIALYLAGVAVAIKGLRASGRRALLLHTAAVALYLLSLWTYEITAGVIALTGMLYLTQAPWRRAVPRWLLDVVVTAASLLLVTRSTQNEALPLAHQIDHARLIAREGAQLIALSAVPFGTPARWLICGGIAFIALLAAAAWRSLPPGDALRRLLARWFAFGVGGLVFAGAGWVVFAPAHWYYTPTPVGLANRVNVLAALGLVTLAYATLVVLGLLVARVFTRIGRWWVLVPFAGAAVIGIQYLSRLEDDKNEWNQAFRSQTAMLRQMKAGLADPPDGSTIFTFGWPGYQAPGVPIFASSWDLNGAVKVEWNDATLSGYPILESTTLRCGTAGITIVGQGYESMNPAAYGRAYLFDVRSGRVAKPASRKQCEAATPRFLPGPLYRAPA